MKLQVGSRTEEVDSLIAKGGEGAVFKDPGDPSSAIKVYHDAPSAKVRAKKVGVLAKLSDKFPDEVIGPLEEVYRTSKSAKKSKKFAGFRMKLLDSDYVKLNSIFASKFCTTYGINLEAILSLMIRSAEVMQLIHNNDCRLGDLNHGAIMVHKKDHSAVFVDVDSWDLPKYPCVVGSDMYLHPELYGEDLSDGKRHFLPHHDWYSYTILLLRALIRQHPFIVGLHPKHKGRLARAKNGLSMFNSSVVVKPGVVGLPFEVLSNELIDYFEQILTGDNKNSFELERLIAFRSQVVSCSSCSQQYSATRDSCPLCANTSQVAGQYGTSIAELLHVKGRVLYVQQDLGRLLILTEERKSMKCYVFNGDTKVQEIDLKVPFEAGMRFGFVKDLLCIAFNTGSSEEKLLLVEISASKIKVEKSTSTSSLIGHGPVFGVTRRGVFRVAGQTLLFSRKENGVRLDKPVTEVFKDQSFIWSDTGSQQGGRDRVVIFDRSLAGYRWRLSRSQLGTGEFRTRDIEVTPLPKKASLQDVAVYFSLKEVLVVCSYKKSGKEFVVMDLFDVDDEHSFTETVSLEDKPEFERIDGWAFAGRTLMRPTDEGVEVQSLGASAPSTSVLSGTLSVTGAEDRLLPFGSGLVVQRSDRVLFVTP